MNLLSAVEKTGIPLEMEDTFTLPDDVFAFPPGDNSFTEKLIKKDFEYEIWPEQKIKSWSAAQGMSITDNSLLGGWAYKRAMIFYPPGISFSLYANVQKKSRFGWKLYLDMGFLKSRDSGVILTTDFRNYENILRYTFKLNGIFFKSIEIGFGQTHISPVELAIPYIRDPEGKIDVEILLDNHPNSFGVLYDAFISNEKPYDSQHE